MAHTYQELSDEMDSIMAGVQLSKTLTIDLKAQIVILQSQQGPVSQAQLDALDAKADAILAAQQVAPVTPPTDPPIDEV